MTFYTITIAPDGDGATTSLRLDATSTEVRVIDLNVHAEGGLGAGDLPAIDFGLLLRAIGQPTGAARPTTAPTAVPTPEPTPAQATRKATAKKATAKKATAKKATGRKATARKATGRKATARAATNATAKATRKTARKAAGKATGRRAAKATKATRTEGTGARAYRRMPDDFAAVYRQTGSAAQVAEHYGVPKHTVYGWIRRL